ncbi:MAG: ABC transporter substrate-binding protein [Acetobacteraceae bacterium]
MRRLFGAAWRSAVLGLVAATCLGGAAVAQKRGGTLVMPLIDTPPSPSLHEEATISVVVPFMSMFNNLLIYDQHIEQNRDDTLRPELATKWSWDDSRTKLTFALRDGVKWHDGKPFTAADVKCTFDMVSGLAPGKIRKSPRQQWYANVKEITVNGDREVTFHLNRPQPSLLSMLASGYSPIYPCHVSSAQMRTKPVGTGPFRFVEYRMNEIVRLERNPDYWKPGLPYLDGMEVRIVPNRATRMLGLQAGKFDVSFPTDVTVALVKDLQKQSPEIQCRIRAIGTSNLIINREAPPFDNPDIRKALALTLDRKAFNRIMNEDVPGIGASMLPAPAGTWGVPQEMLETFPGYGPDIAKSREEARALMRKAGYGPDKRLAVKIFTRNISTFRDPALILADNLKEIYVDAELDAVETPQFYNRVFKKDYQVGMNATGYSLDDPDQVFYENYGCGSLRNYTNYCNRDIQAMFDAQSVEQDAEKRRKMVWEIERQLLEDVARPVTYHGQQAGCWHPYVKNYGVMVNSIYNGWRFEDVWLDR